MISLKPIKDKKEMKEKKSKNFMKIHLLDQFEDWIKACKIFNKKKADYKIKLNKTKKLVIIFK